MSRLSWDERDYQAGISHGVFYPATGPAVAWNGLISVEESASLLKDQTRYVDGVKVGNFKRADSYEAKVTAFTYPDSFYDNVFAIRRQRNFGFSYRTSGLFGDEFHIIYNIQATASDVEYGQDEAAPFEWLFSTTPRSIPEAKPSAHLIVNTSDISQALLDELENFLYGSEAYSARLATPQEIYDMFEEYAILRVIDHGDGTFTVTGPDSAIVMLNSTTFQITWPSATYIDESTYKIRSL